MMNLFVTSKLLNKHAPITLHRSARPSYFRMTLGIKNNIIGKFGLGMGESSRLKKESSLVKPANSPTRPHMPNTYLGTVVPFVRSAC